MIGSYPFGMEKTSTRPVVRGSETADVDLYVAKDGDGSWAFATEGAVVATSYGHPTRRAALFASADAVRSEGWRAA